MKTLLLINTILLVPIMALILYSRGIWTGILTILASLGLSTCRAEEGKTSPELATTQTSPKDAPPEVLCYRQAVPKPVFTNAQWDSSEELRTWAETERVVRAYVAGGERKDFASMEPRIHSAEIAYDRAKAAVEQGIFSQGVYEMAGKILSEWHRELALNYTSIKCYEEAMILPEVEDVNSRLMTLEKLEISGKLTDETKTQAQAGIRKSLQGSLKSNESKELAEFLVQLLGF